MTIETSEQQSTRLCRHVDGCTDRPASAAIYALSGRKPSLFRGSHLIDLAGTLVERLAEDPAEERIEEWILAITEEGIERFPSVGEQWPDTNAAKIVHRSPTVGFRPTPDWFEMFIDGTRFRVKPQNERFARTVLAPWSSPPA